MNPVRILFTDVLWKTTGVRCFSFGTKINRSLPQHCGEFEDTVSLYSHCSTSGFVLQRLMNVFGLPQMILKPSAVRARLSPT